MTAVEKFRFELNFDDAETVIRPAGAEEEHYSLKKKKKKQPEDEAPPPPPAIYTEEQMTQMVAEAEARAREAAFAEGQQQGLEAGRQEILASLEKHLADTLETVGGHLAHIDEQQKRAQASIAEDSIHVATAIMRKLAPAWTSDDVLVEIEHIVRQSLSNLFDTPKVMVQVHPDLTEPLEEKVQEIARTRGFSGQIVVVGEHSIEIGDCRVSWGDGTAVRDSRRIWGEINAIVERAIALHRDAHDLGETEMADPEVQATPPAQKQSDPTPPATDASNSQDGSQQIGNDESTSAPENTTAQHPMAAPSASDQAANVDLPNVGNETSVTGEATPQPSSEAQVTETPTDEPRMTPADAAELEDRIQNDGANGMEDLAPSAPGNETGTPDGEAPAQKENPAPDPRAKQPDEPGMTSTPSQAGEENGR